MVARLNELSDVVAEGGKGIAREFYMSVSATQYEHDVNLVLAAATKRIEDLEHKISLLEDELELNHNA